MAKVNIQTVTLSGYKATVDGALYLVLGTLDSYGIEQLQINAGPEWDGLVIKAVFVTPAGATAVIVPDNGLINVPPEATAQALTVGKPGAIVFSGVTAGVQRISCNLPYLVRDHAPIDGTAPEPTPDEWAQFVAMVQQYAQQASQSATAAADSATTAEGSATQANQSAAAAGKSAQDAAAELEKVQGAGSAALQAIGTAQSTAVGAVQNAQQSAVQAVEQAGTTQVGAVNTAGQQQNTAIQQAGQTATKQVQDEGTTQAKAVTEAGNAKLQQIEEANALLPTPTEADAGKAPIAQPDGTYALQEVTVDAYTKAESDARYAPIEAAIKVSGKGTGLVSLSPTVGWGMQGLTLYGRSWQDGTPSVETEVPIQNAGQSGQVDVTVCGMNLLDTDELINNMQYVTNTGALSPLNGRVSTPKISNFGVPIYVYVPAEISIILVQFNSAGELISRTFHNPNTKIILNAECIEFAITIYTYQNDGIVDFDVIKKNMVIGPALVDQYYPYVVPQQLPIPTPDGLPGIPVDSGGNWTDENGQQWVSNVVDLAAGTKTQNCVAVNASDFSFNLVETFPEEGTVRYDTYGLSTGAATWTNGAGISNFFSPRPNGTENGPGIFQASGSVIRFWVNQSDFPTAEDFNTWLKAHDVVLLLPQATPITTPLGAETVAAFKALQSYPGTTNVLAPDCGIEAAAVAEPNQYIEDKIQAAITQAVAQAVELTGGNI